MRNLLIFACIAGIASAIAIYFVAEADKEMEPIADDSNDVMNPYHAMG